MIIANTREHFIAINSFNPCNTSKRKEPIIVSNLRMNQLRPERLRFTGDLSDGRW